MTEPPRSVLLACWAQALLAGLVGPDDAAAAVRGEDPQHLVVKADGSAQTLDAWLSSLPRDLVTLALPAPGDPLGLGGPPAMNQAALDSGEAVLVPAAGCAVVPELDARTVLWRVYDAAPAPYVDAAEADRALRQGLLDVTRRLVDLDVASWQPEIPDLLMNLEHRPPLPLPSGYDPRRASTIDRALLCLEIGALAAETDGGALSVHQMQERRSALGELDRLARRALVGACSAPAR